MNGKQLGNGVGENFTPSFPTLAAGFRSRNRKYNLALVFQCSGSGLDPDPIRSMDPDPDPEEQK